MTTFPKTFSEAEAVLAANLPGYESRPHQQKLARSVEEAIADGNHLLGQAGCGTGKSLGYLIPAILSGKQIVVTTATKALQDQLILKDLPFLQEHLGVPFTFAALKGRSNYACLARTQGGEATEISVLGDVLAQINADSYVPGQPLDDSVFYAQREDFNIEISDQDWRKMTATSDECPGKRDCPFGGQCYAERAKARAAQANVLVVNHALFCVDLILREKTEGAVNLLGDFDIVIADEAHELEEYATGAFSAKFHDGTFNFLAGDIRAFANREGQLPKVESALSTLAQINNHFWDSLPNPERNQQTRRLRMTEVLEHEDAYVEVIDALNDLRVALFQVYVPSEDIKASARKAVLVRRINSVVEKFIDLTITPDSELVRWISIETFGRRNHERKVLNSAPVSVATILRRLLFERTTSILVSATLPFDHIAERLGVDAYDSVDVGTPFDFTKQALLYVPDIAEPTPKNREQWQRQAIEEIEALVTASDGRALLLFTSNADLNAAYRALAHKLPYKVLKQGERPNRVLAAEFTADVHSVLFATRSFFTGVDFQGDTASLVVLSKLPFPVPSEPMVEARCEAIENSGGNSFGHYTIPEMTLPLQQGFGRLIRHRNDRGVVAILDPRLVSKSYGKQIVKALPDAPLVRDLDEVERFFANATEGVDAM
jgi:ATP-dependent DNA helicase DinG